LGRSGACGAVPGMYSHRKPGRKAIRV
jgi:hypothetical protein